MNQNQSEDRGYPFKFIVTVSVLVPLIIALLIFMPKTEPGEGSWIHYLPSLHAVLNSGTALCLILGLVFIKQKNIAAHRNVMLTAFGLSIIFIISYLIYHSQAPSTKFGDLNGDGTLDPAEWDKVALLRPVYLFVLISHILLAVVAVPFVLMAIYFGLDNQVERHKKVVKWGYPIWLYVAVTGVIVYFMIRPYY